MQPVGVALLGVGRWGTHLLRNLLKHPQAEVVAIVDPALERLLALPQQHDLSDRMTLTTDWQAVLRMPEVQAVVVATPAATHYPLIQAALQHQCHVLAEKPLTLTVEEAHALCRLANQQQRQLVIDHTYLFHPAVRQGHLLLQQQALGELRYGYATRTHLGPVRQDVDALWDLAIHDIAIFNHWLQENPIQVQARGIRWLPSPALNDPSCETSPPNGSQSDLVWIQLTYPSGFQAFIHVCWANPDKQRRLSVVGSQGTLVFDELAAAPLQFLPGRLEFDQQFVPIAQPAQVIALEAVEPLQQVCSHFLHCVQHNLPSPISPGWLGAELVTLLTALTQSLYTGQAITIRSTP